MFEVIKEYAGVKVGSTIECKKPLMIAYMVSNGYWERPDVPKKMKSKKAVDISKTNKVDPELATRKNK